MSRITVAAIQTAPVFGQSEDNVETALASLPPKCDLAVLPELCNTGYQFRTRDEARELAEEIPAGPTCRRLLATAADHQIHLVAGLAERSGDRVYNSAVLCRPDGSWELYRKIHLFWNEKDIFDPGDLDFAVVEASGTRIGLMICFDWIYPEAARTLALAGAVILVHPSNLVLPHCPQSMPVRCIENRVFAITANRVGTENRTGDSLTFIGRSQVLGPDGQRLAACDEENPGVAVAEIDPDEARQPVTPRNDVLTDRRPQFYRL
jgi:predicted amidohydrolase